MSTLAHVSWLFVIAQVGALPFLLAASVGRSVRHAWPEHRTDVLIAAGLGVVALVARLVIAEPTLIHENHHAYGFVTALGFGGDWVNHGSVSSHVTLVWLASLLPGPTDSALFVANAIISSAGVVGFFAFGRLVFGSRLAGWIIGTLLALQPLSVMMAPTEEFLVSAGGLLLVGLPLLWSGLQRQDWLLIVTGTIAISLAGSARELATPLLAIAALIVVALPVRPRWRDIGLCFGLLTALNLLRALTVLAAAGEAPEGFVSFSLTDMYIASALWRDPWVPEWTVALAGVGSALLLVRAGLGEWRLAVVALCPFVIAALAAGLITGGYITSALRHQTTAMALLLLPTGALAWPRLEKLLFVLVPIACAAQLAWSPPIWDVPAAAEYHWLRDAIADLPTDARVVVPDDTEPGKARISARWLMDHKPGWTPVPLAERRPGTLLLLDRSCFHCASEEMCAKMTPTRLGHMDPGCSRALEAAPWKEVAGYTLHRDPRPTTPMQPLDPEVRVVLLTLPD